jgi:hypothetical protein
MDVWKDVWEKRMGDLKCGRSVNQIDQNFERYRKRLRNLSGVVREAGVLTGRRARGGSLNSRFEVGKRWGS